MTGDAAAKARKCCKETDPEGCAVLDLDALDGILDDHAADSSGLIPVLQATQEHYGYLPEEALHAIAKRRGIPFASVYGVATFYAQFHLQPRGKTLLRICHGTACHVRGAPDVTRAITEELGVKVGETSNDLRFTVESVACVGCCGLAPVILVDQKTYGQLDVASARKIGFEIREGEQL